jgi:type I restriction enzyme R subunit
VDPFTRFGTPIQIVKLFGDKRGYERAVRELGDALYQKAT